MKQTQEEEQKTQFTNQCLNQFTPDVLKNIFIQSNIFTEDIQKSEDCLNWVKCKSFEYSFDTAFSRPMKNIEFEKIDNVGQWFAYYNVQLPIIIIERLNTKIDSSVLLKTVQITVLNGKIQKVSELVGDTAILYKPDQRVELKGLKLNTPQKIQNKKKCIHHIAVCAFKQDPLNQNSEAKLIGLSISGGFSLKSRKKSHQEKGLDTSYFKPLDLTQNLHQRKIKQQPVSITNDFQGLKLYFTSPNIRHKIVHPLFLSIRFSEAVKLYLCEQTFPYEDTLITQVKKICTEFSSSAQVSKKKKQQPIIVVINSSTFQQDLTEEELRREKKSMEKIQKAIECAKNSKCQYIVGNEEFNMDDYPNHYHFEIQEKKDDIVNAYKSICQSNFGASDCDWLNQEQISKENPENNSTISSQNRSNSIQLRSIIDVNKCRRDNKNNIQLYRVQVFSEDTQSHHEIQKILPISIEENLGNTEDMLSQANFSFQKESQRTIISSEKIEHCKLKENFNKVQIRDNIKNVNVIPSELENLQIQPKSQSAQLQSAQQYQYINQSSPNSQQLTQTQQINLLNMNGMTFKGENVQIMNNTLQNLFDKTKQLQIQQPQMSQNILNLQNVLNICNQQQSAQFLQIPLHISQNQQQQPSENGFYFPQNQIQFPLSIINQPKQIPIQPQFLSNLAQNNNLATIQRTFPQLQEANISNVLKQIDPNNKQVINDILTQNQFINQTLQQSFYKKI